MDLTILEIDQNHAVSCESLLRNDSLMGVVDQTVAVGPKELISLLKPGDVLLTRMMDSRANTVRKKIFRATMSAVQRSIYTSSKLVADVDTLMGYGISAAKPNFTKYSSKVYIPRLQKGMLIRHKDMTPELAAAIKQEAIRFVGLPYNLKEMLTSALRRFKESLVKNPNTPNGVTEDPSTIDLAPLICSSVIGAIFARVGLPVAVNRSWKEMWPGDFVLGQLFHSVAKIDR
jgi:hypothetical protein